MPSLSKHMRVERIDELLARLVALRPLSEADVRALWSRFQAEMPAYVQGSNAIEGNTLTLGETIVVLQDGVTIGGKSLREHLEAINGAKAFNLMLDMAQNKRPITINTILALHELVVAGDAYAGAWRTESNRITGSRHVTPNAVKVPALMQQALETYAASSQGMHPVALGASLHYAIASIHPFTDGNGRTARLVNNLHLLQNGFTPVLLTMAERPAYIDALERSHTAGNSGEADPAPFVAFMATMEERSLRHHLHALEVERS